MVLLYIRLRKRGINQIVGSPVCAFQEYLCLELIVRLQEVYSGVFQFYRMHVLRKLSLVIVSEDQLADIPAEFRVETVYDLV